MSYELFGWVASIFLISASWLIGDKLRFGFLLSILGQAIYIYISSMRGNWSLVFMSSVFSIMAVRNWFQWGKSNVGQHGSRDRRDSCHSGTCLCDCSHCEYTQEQE